MKKSSFIAGSVLTLMLTALGVSAALPAEFSDVSSKDWFYEGVQYASENNLMTGYENKTFGPNDVVNRAQLATILERMDAGSIEKMYFELEALRDYETNQLMGSSWLEYVDTMRRFPIGGVQGNDKVYISTKEPNEVVATDKVNSINVLANKSISSNTAAFFLQAPGKMGNSLYGPYYDNLERIVAEIEDLNTNVVD